MPTARMPAEVGSSGSLCLDFANAGCPATPRDDDREALTAWLRAAGLPMPITGVTYHDVNDARRLAVAIDAVTRAVTNGAAPRVEHIRCINQIAAHATPVYLLRPSGRDSAPVDQADLGATLSVIARDAITLVSRPDITRLRTCERCGSLFFDRSRSGARRWCSMQRCGEQAASAAYRTRRANRPQTKEQP